MREEGQDRLAHGPRMDRRGVTRQDMALIRGQHELIESSGAELQDLWLPLKTCDRLVVEYRKWLDRHASGLPHYRGFSTHRSAAPGNTHSNATELYSLHTANCTSCRTAYRLLGGAIATGLAGMLVVLPILSSLLEHTVVQAFQAALGGFEIGFDRQGRFVMLDRLLELTHLQQHVAQILVGIGHFRVDANRFPVGPGGHHQIVEMPLRDAQVVIPLATVFVLGDGFPQDGRRLGRR